MKLAQCKRLVFVAAWAAFTTIAVAADPETPAEPTLKIGDPAPKMQPGQWLQGTPVTVFRPGKAYLIDFWATWCGRRSIPRVNEIYVKYKTNGLIVVGQNSFETNDSTVAAYIAKMGDKMTYPIALDDKSSNPKGAMADAWVNAAGRSTIPCAFLIDLKGNVAWMGHPMELKDEVIDKVLDGTFDLKQAAEKYNARLKDAEERRKAMAPAEAKMKAMAEAIHAKKWDEASADLEAAEKLVPESRRGAVSVTMEMSRFSILMGKKDYAKASVWADKVGEANNNNPRVQNYLAWELATYKDAKPNLEVAGRLADRAVQLTGTNNAEFLDTQALILFMKGQKDDAVVAQTKAVALAPAAQKQALQARLDSYKKGELPATN
jgi:Spy/CpxP family protein refolding chaperone